MRWLLVAFLPLLISSGLRPSAVLQWDYPTDEIPDVTFHIYESTNLTDWTGLVSVTTTQATVQIQPGKRFYFVTASNEFGESLPSNIESVTVPRGINTLRIR